MEVSPSFKKLPLCIFFLSAFGLLFSVIALWEHVIYTHGLAQEPSFCNISAQFNCEAVNASEWSKLFGLPIASYGVFFFLSGVVSAMYTGSRGVFSHLGFAGLALVSGGVATIGSVILFLISKIVIGSICLICVGMYVVSIGIFVAASVIGRGESISARLAACGAEIGQMFGVTLGGAVPKGRSRIDFQIYFACIMGIAVLAGLSPQVALSFAPAKQPIVTPSDPIALWKSGRHFDISIDTTRGSFGDYVKGPLDAPITIVEFADFECPACRRLYQMMKPWLSHFEGKYRLVFKNYPLDNACNPGINRLFHKFGCVAAFTSRCAGEQGRFWEAVDFLFTYEKLDTDLEVDVTAFGNRLYADISSELSLDQVALQECVESNRYRDVILKDISEGTKIDLQSTPTIMVNGRKAPYRPLDALEAIFKQILGG